MHRSDFLILGEVRRELARSETILESIKFSIQMGVKNLDGKKHHDALVGTLVALEKRLRRVPGVRDVIFRFSNIQKTGGFWRRAKEAKKSTSSRRGSTPQSQVVERNELRG